MPKCSYIGRSLAIVAFTCMANVAAEPTAESTDATYQRLCAQCHGPDRLGGVGPALIPETLGRLEPGKRTWTAPYRSDWAIAVGAYHR